MFSYVCVNTYNLCTNIMRTQMWADGRTDVLTGKQIKLNLTQYVFAWPRVFSYQY